MHRIVSQLQISMTLLSLEQVKPDQKWLIIEQKVSSWPSVNKKKGEFHHWKYKIYNCKV